MKTLVTCLQSKANIKFKPSNASAGSNGVVAINLKGAFPSESEEFLNIQDWDDIEVVRSMIY